MKLLKINILILLALILYPAFSYSGEKIFVVDGWQIKTDLNQQNANGPLPLIILLNRAGSDKSEYKSLSNKLLEKGFATLAVDLRGHGQSTNLDTFDFRIRRNFDVLTETYKDISSITNWAKQENVYNKIAIIGASYSAEHMMKAAEISGYVDAYIALSPGDFSDESIDKIDATGKPWFFLRTENELPFFDELFLKIKDRSNNAKIKIVNGDGHASMMLQGRPSLEDELVRWVEQSLVE